MREFDAEVEYEGVEDQTYNLDQIERGKAQYSLIFLLEVEVAIQDKTANHSTVEADDVGSKIGDPAA